VLDLQLSDGARLHYRDEGAGAIVLLVHGGTGTGDYDWEFLRPELSRRYRVITPDLRGHGRSSDPQWRLSMDSIASDMVALTESLGERPRAVVAFSVGGSAMLRLLCRRPDMTDAFVGIGLSRIGDPTRVEAIVNGPWPSQLVALEHEHGAGTDHWRNLRRRMATTWADDLSITDDELGKMTIPSLVVCGDRDRIEPVATAQSIARTLPAGELLVLPAAGHFVIRDRPEVFAAAVVDFLDRHLAEPAAGSSGAAAGRGSGLP
jgi:pimeloyl-ACP methyl ester carboxylesterase